MATTTDRPPSTEELDEARDRLRRDAIDREFGEPAQLSFDLGAGRRAAVLDGLVALGLAAYTIVSGSSSMWFAVACWGVLAVLWWFAP